VEDYREINRVNWDERAPLHAMSPDYAVERFVADPTFLSGVVRFDLPRLGELAGLRGAHLQCHIGTDTISLARLGATMTGLDLSPASLDEARRLAARTRSPVDFVEAEVYAAPEVLGREGFDLVYTGIGALCWLPDIARWAQVVADLLRPGGRLFVREGHPVLWAMDERQTDRTVLGYPYFEQLEPLIEEANGTYVEVADQHFAHNVTHSWNHDLGRLLTGLLDAGMTLTGFVEHDSVPWEALPGQMVRDDAGEYRLAAHPERLAASYTLQAVKTD
jgi:SAM-dependent methyltransferase